MLAGNLVTSMWLSRALGPMTKRYQSLERQTRAVTHVVMDFTSTRDRHPEIISAESTPTKALNSTQRPLHQTWPPASSVIS